MESIDDDRSLLLQEPLALFETDFLPWLRSNEMMQRNISRTSLVDESKTEMELFFFLSFLYSVFLALLLLLHTTTRRSHDKIRRIVKWELTSNKQVQYVKFSGRQLQNMYQVLKGDRNSVSGKWNMEFQECQLTGIMHTSIRLSNLHEGMRLNEQDIFSVLVSQEITVQCSPSPSLVCSGERGLYSCRSKLTCSM